MHWLKIKLKYDLPQISVSSDNDTMFAFNLSDTDNTLNLHSICK